VLGIDVDRIPDQPSLAYDQIVEAVADGRIKGLWVIATNSAHSWIDQRRLHETFGSLEFLVVQDMYSTTETAALADLVLPAAGWGEKEGTFINSERRIGVTKKIARAPGEALADFSIFRLVADAWGCHDLFSEWTSPEAVWSVVTRLSAGRPCDISGVGGYTAIDDAGGIQWPCPSGATVAPRAERRLFEDGRFFHDDGRARFCFEESRATAEVPSAEYPLMLLTGRGSSSQWHTQTRTAKSTLLQSMSPIEPYLEISPVDAMRRDLHHDDWTIVSSRRGTMRARARITPAVAPGAVFVPMHYAQTNRLTAPAFDPHSRQPSYKTGAVEVTRAGRRPK
jgi:assimilatory nitrate reductase catalytic subunit